MQPRPAQSHPRARSRGFTLIEVLVAIAIMALLAIMSWRGLDGMTRAQAQTQARSDEVLAVQAGVGQWQADLDAMATGPGLRPLDWDGQVLRLTRRPAGGGGEGLRVVAWTRRATGASEGQWLRWQSPEILTLGDWQQAWNRATLWAQNPGDAERRLEIAVLPLMEWQVFYYRNNAWSNSLSSDEGASAPAPTAGAIPAGALAPSVPDGIRLVLTLPPGQALTGRLTQDWVNPILGGGKS